MFGNQVVTDAIRRVPMFAGCSRRELLEISRLVTELNVETGRELTTEGAPGKEFMIVLAGTAEVRKGGLKVGEIGPGDYFGEIALLDNGPRTATVTAVTPMTLAVVGRLEFAQLIDDVPGLARKIMGRLATRLREVDTPIAV